MFQRGLVFVFNGNGGIRFGNLPAAKNQLVKHLSGVRGFRQLETQGVADKRQKRVQKINFLVDFHSVIHTLFSEETLRRLTRKGNISIIRMTSLSACADQKSSP